MGIFVANLLIDKYIKNGTLIFIILSLLVIIIIDKNNNNQNTNDSTLLE